MSEQDYEQFKQQESVEYPPMAGTSKADMAQHLIEVHGVKRMHVPGGQEPWVVSARGRITLEQMHEEHEKQHRVLESPDAVPHSWHRNFVVIWEDNKPGTTIAGHARIPVVKHHHSAVLSDEDTARVKAARSGGRITEGVLTASERRTLSQLVDNDFAMLKSEMRAFAADALKQRREAIKAEWKDRDVAGPNYVAQAQEVMRKAAESLSRLRDEAAKEGITLTTDYSHRQPLYKIDGYQQALREAEAENTAMLDRALMTLERQRLGAQRRVLLSGVTEEASKILDDIPDAKTLMVEAQKDRATDNSITA